MSQKSGKGDALRKEKALLHTFVAGQKYGVGRDATRRFCLSKKQQGQQINHLLPLLFTVNKFDTYLKCSESLACGFDRLVEIFLRVSDTHEAGFVLRGCDVDALVEHAAEELGEDLRCLRFDVAEVEYFLRLEVGAEHAANPLQRSRDIGVLPRLPADPCRGRRFSLRVLVEAVLLE